MLKYFSVWLVLSAFQAEAIAQSAGTNGSAPVMADAPYVLPRMVSPDIDLPGKPFSFPSRPTDQIGVMGSPTGTEITPEGYLYTGYGELMFFLGLDRMPLHQRLRELEDGYLPVVLYEEEHDGLMYRFTTFSASIAPSQDGTRVVNFVRVTVHNPTPTARRGYVTSAWRYNGEQTTAFPASDNRFRRPVEPKRPGGYTQPGEAFNPASVYTTNDHAFLRDGRVVYLFPHTPEPALARAFRGYYSRKTPVEAAPIEDGKPIATLPTTPMALAEYAVDVAPGSDITLDFKMPLQPVAPDDSFFQAIQQASFDTSHAAVLSFWRAMLNRGTQITTPEKKVNDVFRASLVNDLLALNKVGDDYVQTINQLHYHGFYLRDSSDFIRMYDTTGYPDIGGKVLNFFGTRQGEDGNFLSQPGQFDGWGYALLTYGEHFRMTHDKASAAQIYPRVQRAVAWLKSAMAADPLHLMPATDVHDNEFIPGHLTGYNFLALSGLQAAELLARDLNHPEDEKEFRKIEAELRSNFLHRLDEITRGTGGYIPPALDGDSGGADWGNLLSLTPELQLSPDDPRVLNTLQTAQSRYQEGLMTYREPNQGTYLHHYLTIKNTLTELILGQQEQAIRELYALLVHTTSTQGGFEYSIRPWGDRDFNGNLSPHGWFAAEYRNLLRNMMVREQGQTLHLLSAVSPAWVGTGKVIDVKDAPTFFGPLSFRMSSTSEDTVDIELHTHFAPTYEPKNVLLHMPWFMEVTAITIDGKPASSQGGLLQIPAGARHVQWRWKQKSPSVDLPKDYLDAVERYKAEYRSRYMKLTTGTLQ